MIQKYKEFITSFYIENLCDFQLFNCESGVMENLI